jgi:DNA polymerase-3 subunit delta'
VLSAGEEDAAASARHRRLALAGRHPDLHVFERIGPAIAAAQADEIVARASLSALEGPHQLLVLLDFELVRDDVGPKLLKTIEEPSPSTVFVVIATEVPAALVTIASRCVRVPFRRVPDREVGGLLAAEGVEPERAASITAAANGNLRRARLLARDPEFTARSAAWFAAPAALDGTGATVVTTSAELIGTIDRAAAPLKARHAEEIAALDEEERLYGVRRGVRKPMADRHKREMRRLRTDEMRQGLSMLGARVRNDLLDGSLGPERAARAMMAIDAAGEALVHNSNERLLLQSILLAASPR